MHRWLQPAPLALAAAGVLWASSASADLIRSFQVANWRGGAYTRQGTNEFNHCAASARYKSGVSMLFAITRGYRWSIGFASPEWRLVRGNKYPLAFQIDDGSPVSAQGTAIGTGQIEVLLADNTTLFNQFRWGQQLRVSSAGQVLTFKLTDTSEILPELMRCVTRHAGTTPPPASEAAKNFFGPQPTAPSAPSLAPSPAPVAATPGGDSTSRVEATALAANLLAQSGINGFQILGPGDLGRLRADAAWKAGQVIGTISLLTASDVTLDQIPGKVIGTAAQSCRGKFFSGSMPDTQAGTAVARVFTACQREGSDALTIYYLGVPRPAGGFYVLTTSAMGSEQPAKEADQNLRSAVYKVLSK